jgi:hypothetical protein
MLIDEQKTLFEGQNQCALVDQAGTRIDCVKGEEAHDDSNLRSDQTPQTTLTDVAQRSDTSDRRSRLLDWAPDHINDTF